MKYRNSYEQFCPKEDKNIMINEFINHDGSSEICCENSDNCEEKCNHVNNISTMLNQLRSFI